LGVVQRIGRSFIRRRKEGPMPEELFSRTEVRSRKSMPTFEPRCGQCGLFQRCKSPKLPVAGKGGRKIVIVGPPPGSAEDDEGSWLTGREGKWFDSELKRVGIDWREDAWVTGALICAPGKDRPATAVDDCRPNLLRVIKQLDPEIIILVGTDAVRSLIGHLWKDDPGPVTKWTGRQIPAHKPNAWICPVNDLEYLTKDKPDVVSRLHFRDALQAVAALKGRPWPGGPPDYASQVEIIKSPTEAARRLAMYAEGALAFDYETDRLRPDHRDARLVSCAVCYNGTETIAFPWHGPVIPQMRRILSDPTIGKIASNLNMEDRWTRKVLGEPVAGWLFDTMLGAHVLDARKGAAGRDDQERGSGTTGLKFQAFVRLGQSDYSGHLDDMLKAVVASGKPGTNDPNRVRDIKLDDLLLYNGLDSLLEWMIAQQMMRELNYAC
jgi:uracil-DNA glycosylase family 4